MTHIVRVALLLLSCLAQEGFSQLSADTQCTIIQNRGLCQNAPYNHSALPNYRNGTSPLEINQELATYLTLYLTGCSNAVVHLLCAYYYPFCANLRLSDRETVKIIPPCRELCLYVRASCEPELADSNLINSWPPHFDCDQFPPANETDLCLPSTSNNITVYQKLPLLEVPGTGVPLEVKRAEYFWSPSTVTTTPPNNATPTPTQPPGPQCVPDLWVGNNSGDYREYSLAGYKQCGVPCVNDYFSVGRDVAVPVVVLIFSIFGIISTVFIIATALIERERFHYPERPIVFLACCYFVISLLFMVGSSSKLANTQISCSPTSIRPTDTALTSMIFQHLPQSDLASISARSGGCVAVFFFLYWATMASFIWWDVLTFTWFLAATLKWAEEAISKFWLLYHIIAWGIPVIQAAIVMGNQLVDGDQHSGVCYLGNFNRVGLGVFVFLPVLVYLIVGIVFLIIGFTSLVNIHKELAKDHQKSRHLQRLIFRVGLFSALYVIPNAILVILYIYELAVMDLWQTAILCYNDNSALPECSEESYSLSSIVVAVVLKYIMWLVVGINICCWVMTKKTYSVWKQLFSDIIPCLKRHIGSNYDVKNQNSSSRV